MENAFAIHLIEKIDCNKWNISEEWLYSIGLGFISSTAGVLLFNVIVYSTLYLRCSYFVMYELATSLSMFASQVSCSIRRVC